MPYSPMKHDWFIGAARVCGVAVLAACASTAQAEPDQAASAPTCKAHAGSDDPARSAGAALAQARATSPRDSLGFGPPADPGKLDQSRGGTDMHTDMKLDGVVSGNSAINVVSGNNTIDAGAFANMSGIPVVIQNSGANVLIQNATIVNLQFK